MIKQINLTDLFCYVDDFSQAFEKEWNKRLIGHEPQDYGLAMGEVLTILILFHLSGARNFKYFYLFLLQFHKPDFPKLLSYSRFVEIEKSFLIPLMAFLQGHLSLSTGIGFIDATQLKVCHNKRINSNKVFKGLGKIGKSSMGWFFGFKLHAVVNEFGQLLAYKITKGNFDDRKAVKSLCKTMSGKVFGDKGYISQELFEEMLKNGVKIVTQLKSKMKTKMVDINESELLKKRSVIESVFRILKEMMHLNHTRHRSPLNFLVNIIAALCAYCLYPNKPKVKMPKKYQQQNLFITA